MTKYTFIFGDIQFPNPNLSDTNTYVSNYVELVEEFATKEGAEAWAELQTYTHGCDSYIIKELYNGDITYIKHD